MQRRLLILAILSVGGSVLTALLFMWASSPRYPQEQYTQVRQNHSLPQRPPKEVITVMSYNIGYLSGLTNNRAVPRSRPLYERNLATAIAAIQTIKPDVLALQEVDLDSRRSFHVNQVDELGQTLDYAQQAIAINWDKHYVPFPYWPPTAHFGSMLSGQALLSQLPITHHERIVLGRVSTHPFYYKAFYLDRLAQVAALQVNQHTLIVINVHLEAFDTATRSTQTQFVRKLAESYARDHPVILVGDFNSALNRPEEGTFTIQQMLQSRQLSPATPIQDLTQASQYTFPSDQPAYKLDYIFYTSRSLELIHVSVETEAAAASDHLPVLAQFRLRSHPQPTEQQDAETIDSDRAIEQ